MNKFETHLDRLCACANLSPGDGLVWPGTRIRSIEFLARVDIHRIVRSIPLRDAQTSWISILDYRRGERNGRYRSLTNNMALAI